MSSSRRERNAKVRLNRVCAHIASSARAPCSDAFVYSHEVEEALRHGEAVVALESTIISHGMPWPQNAETAKQVEDVVRSAGAVPATIAIVDGVVHIGLTEDVLVKLAKLGRKAHKTSRRDIAHVIGSGATGATTVAGTSLLAARAGISVFATGGIGGVHRGGETSMDVSADLTELGRTPICVVCAGAKSLLDIGRTLEYLETQGVTVAAYGTDEFPAFFTPSSGFNAPTRLNTPEECARVIQASEELNLSSGMVVGVPIPKQHAAEFSQVQRAIEQSVKEAEEQHVSGRDITPFLLGRINELTEGESLKANIALIKNNALVASKIAVALRSVRRERQRPSSEQHQRTSRSSPPQTAQRSAHALSQFLVIGAAVLDVVASADVPLVERSSTPGVVVEKIGGVGQNINSGLHRLGGKSMLLSVLGRDSAGDTIMSKYSSGGMETKGLVRVDSHRTGTYVAVLDHDNDMVQAVADMSILKDCITPSLVSRFEAYISSCGAVVVDGNVSSEVITHTATLCNSHGVPVWFEPTSVAKCVRAIDALHQLTGISPNREELLHMAREVDGSTLTLNHQFSIESMMDAARVLLSRGLKYVLVTMGKDGVLLCTNNKNANNVEPFTFDHAPALPATVRDVTGAGDSLLSGVLLCSSRHQGTVRRCCLNSGLECARTVIEGGTLSPALLS